MRNTGNQHISRKRDMLTLIGIARRALRSCLPRDIRVTLARSYLAVYQGMRAEVPASTLRRWRCGK